MKEYEFKVYHKVDGEDILLDWVESVLLLPETCEITISKMTANKKYITVSFKTVIPYRFITLKESALYLDFNMQELLYEAI